MNPGEINLAKAKVLRLVIDILHYELTGRVPCLQYTAQKAIEHHKEYISAKRQFLDVDFDLWCEDANFTNQQKNMIRSMVRDEPNKTKHLETFMNAYSMITESSLFYNKKGDSHN